MLPLRRSLPLLVLLLIIFGGCAERGPKGPFLTFEQASIDREPRAIRIVKVWDIVKDSVTTYRNVHVSHLIEVESLTNQNTPCPPVWPFDSYAAGTPPPAVGAKVCVSPSQWVGVSLRTPRAP